MARRVRIQSLVFIVVLMVVIVGAGLVIDDLTMPSPGTTKPVEGSEIQYFSSGEELVSAFEEARETQSKGMYVEDAVAGGVMRTMAAEAAHLRSAAW